MGLSGWIRTEGRIVMCVIPDTQKSDQVGNRSSVEKAVCLLQVTCRTQPVKASIVVATGSSGVDRHLGSSNKLLLERQGNLAGMTRVLLGRCSIK
jgi:hypothetical protein